MASGQWNGIKGPAWDRCRAVVFARESVCHICGELVDFDATPRSSRAPSCDHVIPAAQLKLMGEATYRRLAVDPAYCRLAHVGCNSGRRDRPVKRRQPPRVGRDW